jgi:hypothetical protein
MVLFRERPIGQTSKSGEERATTRIAYQSCYSPVAELIHLHLLFTCIDSSRKKIHLDLRNPRLCVVRASVGMSIALNEGQ